MRWTQGADVQIRREQHAQKLHGQLNETIDLCFIDASHFYGDGRVAKHGVLPDYLEFAPHCKIVMFHDVVDYDNWVSYGDGGVPKFWSDLKTNVDPSRIREFVQQPGIYPPTLGIGIVLPATNRAAPEQPPVAYPWKQRGETPWFGSHNIKDRPPY